ncbi:MAG: MIP family channel protein [Ruminococcus sp.]|nr:MIP family channel protein [Ruminococcus sp.]
MTSINKYVAEFIGTFVLVFLGCGTAMLVGCDAVNGGGYILTALAFGLVIVGMAYCVGNISGCHINPAVSLGVLISGGMKAADFVGYIIAQCAGAVAGSAVLKGIFDLGSVEDKTGGYGANGLAGVNGSAAAGLIVEVILTFIFVLTILGVTSKKFKHGSFGGLIIGLTLTLVHIFGIGLTGTSVNPARSFGPALFAGGDALSDLWVFIVGPFLGAILAAIIYKFLESSVPAPKETVPVKAPSKKKTTK